MSKSTLNIIKQNAQCDDFEKVYRIKPSKFPVTLEQYKRKHRAKHGTIAVEERYAKAQHVYSCMKMLPYSMENWKDKDFGELKKPEDAFEIWWDC